MKDFVVTGFYFSDGGRVWKDFMNFSKETMEEAEEEFLHWHRNDRMIVYEVFEISSKKTVVPDV